MRRGFYLFGVLIILFIFEAVAMNARYQDVSKLGGGLSQDHEQPVKYSITENKIPLIYYGYVDGVNLGYQMAPQIVALKAREAFYDYKKTGNKSQLERALFLTDFLLNNSTPEAGGEFLVIKYDFSWPPYNLTTGWRGALCQAGFLKVLLLAYENTGKTRYLEAGNRVLKAFEVSVDKGGFKDERIDGGKSYLWLPEYVAPNPPYVLNGFITALLWIREYGVATSNSRALKIYSEGIVSLKHFVPQYDCGSGCSYYDASKRVASRHYNDLQARQMKWLYNLTKDRMFLKYYERWNQ